MAATSLGGTRYQIARHRVLSTLDVVEFRRFLDEWRAEFDVETFARMIAMSDATMLVAIHQMRVVLHRWFTADEIAASIDWLQRHGATVPTRKNPDSPYVL